MTTTIATLIAEIESWLNPKCAKCARVGHHAVCSKCGVHADADVLKPQPGGMRWNYGRSDLGRLVGCEACGATSQNPTPYNYCGRSCFVPAVCGKLSGWEENFLRSQLEWLRRGRGLSIKQLAIVDRCRAKQTAPVQTTAERDVIDCCPKRGRTFKAVCKAIGWTPVSARTEYGVSKEDMAEVRKQLRALIYDRCGWDKLPDIETMSDAAKACTVHGPRGGVKKDALGDAIMALIEYHRFMVATGRFVEAA